MSTNSDRRPRLPVRIAYLAAGVLLGAALSLWARGDTPARARDFSMTPAPGGTSTTAFAATSDLG